MCRIITVITFKHIKYYLSNNTYQYYILKRHNVLKPLSILFMNVYSLNNFYERVFPWLEFCIKNKYCFFIVRTFYNKSVDILECTEHSCG
jgi:hypothetical protein